VAFFIFERWQQAARSCHELELSGTEITAYQYFSVRKREKHERTRCSEVV
jgi:hypothetical protein